MAGRWDQAAHDALLIICLQESSSGKQFAELMTQKMKEAGFPVTFHGVKHVTLRTLHFTLFKGTY